MKETGDIARAYQDYITLTGSILGGNSKYGKIITLGMIFNSKQMLMGFDFLKIDCTFQVNTIMKRKSMKQTPLLQVSNTKRNCPKMLLLIYQNVNLSDEFKINQRAVFKLITDLSKEGKPLQIK